MARKFLTPIDLTKLELMNAKIHSLASDPGGLVSGDEALIWWNNTSNRLKVWDGSGAGLVASDSDLLQGSTRAFILDRTNHTSTQVASTISNFDTQVRTSRLDQMAAPTASVGLGSQKITGLADGTANTDAASYGQVLSLAQGHDYKDSVRAATTANGALATAFANGQVIDGVTLATGNRILLKNQTTTTENGIYTVNSAGAPTRAVDADTAGDMSGGTIIPVEEGTTLADTLWLITTNGSITPGSTAITFAQFGAGGTPYTAGAGLLLTVNDFSVGAGTGISVAADSVGADFTIVGRKAQGVIPTTTSGIYTVSGAVVTINHGFNNVATIIQCVYHTSPGGGNTQGDPVEVQYNNPDANNSTITFPSAPTSNQYYVMALG